MTQPRNGAGFGRLPLFVAHKMDDGRNTERNAHRAAAWGSPGRVWSRLAAPRIHHPHQKAWCRLGLIGLSKPHPPLVEHVACVGQNL
ncbi:unnamed protein product [Parnassius apollo]|uniref:(apollo) hypothetical protein n=1 Tax=Parnassius apollo TaxID=110799 RepID=A0A8S3WJY8_PARAO|nr:unnamed protein product [Parnassius apollo]